MPKHSKRYNAVRAQVDRTQLLSKALPHRCELHRVVIKLLLVHFVFFLVSADELVWNDLQPLKRQGLHFGLGEARHDPALLVCFTFGNFLLHQSNHRVVIAGPARRHAVLDQVGLRCSLGLLVLEQSAHTNVLPLVPACNLFRNVVFSGALHSHDENSPGYSYTCPNTSDEGLTFGSREHLGDVLERVFRLGNNKLLHQVFEKFSDLSLLQVVFYIVHIVMLLKFVHFCPWFL